MRSRRAERVGKFPKELLTGQAHAHWLELLGFQRLTFAWKGWFKPFAIRPYKTRDRRLARFARTRLRHPKTVETEPRLFFTRMTEAVFCSTACQG